MLQYCQDYDESFPTLGYNWSPQNYATRAWAWRIEPYAKNESIFRCPSIRSSTARFCSYFANQGLCDAWCGPAQTLANVEYPAQTCMTSEQESTFTIDSANFGYWVAISGNKHNAGQNLSFVDGHAKWYKVPPSYSADWGRPEGVIFDF